MEDLEKPLFHRLTEIPKDAVIVGQYYLPGEQAY